MGFVGGCVLSISGSNLSRCLKDSEHPTSLTWCWDDVCVHKWVNGISLADRANGGIWANFSTGEIAKLRLWSFICDKHYRTGQKFSLVSARFPFNPKNVVISAFGDICLLLGCWHQAALHWKRGRAVQLALGNYLGLVNSVEPERAEGWRVSNRSLVSQRGHRTSLGATSTVECCSYLFLCHTHLLGLLLGSQWSFSPFSLSSQQTVAFSFQVFTPPDRNLYRR